MHKDVSRYRVGEQLRRRDLPQLACLLSVDLIVQAAAMTGLAIVKSPLSVPYLVWLALGVALMPTANFATILTSILRVLQDHASLLVRADARQAGSVSGQDLVAAPGTALIPTIP